MWNRIAKSSIIQFLCSYNLTVVCLLLLLILTFWGTLYQVHSGLYVTQQLMFNSWYFWALKFLPFPGARAVLWVSLLNVIAVTLFKVPLSTRKVGLWLTHFGIIVLIISGGITLHFAQESSLSLNEGQALNVSSDYHLWELAIWTESAQGDSIIKNIESINFNDLVRAKGSIASKTVGQEIVLEQIHKNCRAYRADIHEENFGIVNGSGIANLQPVTAEKDPANNLPGLILDLTTLKVTRANNRKLLLFGGEENATALHVGSQIVFFQLRHRRHLLPALIKLVDFIKEDHIGTSMAKSYSSKVLVKEKGFEREVVISMNQPLRLGNYTFYQSSFSQTSDGEQSTFAVVKNPGRVLPYAGSIIIGFGLLLHFVIMLVKYSKRTTGIAP